jgi:hypothetical protein
MNLKKYSIAAALGVGLACGNFSCAPSAPPSSEGSGPANQGPPVLATPKEKETTQAKDLLQERIEAAIAQVKARNVLTTHGFWTVFHAILGLGPELTLYNEATQERINALEYITRGGEMRGLRFIPSPYGLDVQMGPQYVGQGHKDQFAAEMAQWGMKGDQKFIVNGKAYTFLDFVRYSQMNSRTKNPEELSWAIILIAQYIGLEASWTNVDGDKLTLQDCVRYELKEPIVGAACGGTHRLFGLAWVYHLHLLQGGRTEGVWKDLADHQRKYVELAKKFQSSDGSFSTSFFEQRGNAPDRSLKINTTGHTFEWLALTLTDAELREGWVQDAANALALLILEAKEENIEGGLLYHAAHGLIIYHARVYAPQKLGPGGVPIPLPPSHRLPLAQRP